MPVSLAEVSFTGLFHFWDTFISFSKSFSKWVTSSTPAVLGTYFLLVFLSATYNCLEMYECHMEKHLRETHAKRQLVTATVSEKPSELSRIEKGPDAKTDAFATPNNDKSPAKTAHSKADSKSPPRKHFNPPVKIAMMFCILGQAGILSLTVWTIGYEQWGIFSLATILGGVFGTFIGGFVCCLLQWASSRDAGKDKTKKPGVLV
ncbi:uncharacterized protein BDV17DRAFT_295830 [Aspergillus undulatus]|uniref:uncharacterized protein n=1 Tax=Aspergillus undulatus TaxID=1810928 RepID=UPI003CCCCEDD